MGLGDELLEAVNEILNERWDVRQGRAVPKVEDIVLAGEAVVLDGTFLYADLSQSSALVSSMDPRIFGKAIKAFLSCMSRLIRNYEGEVTAFDGDRVMGLFIGDQKNSRAVSCALCMATAMHEILNPQVGAYISRLGHTAPRLSHGVGIDTGRVFAVRAGIYGRNDIVWVGRAPNLAAKLSSIRKEGYSTFISSDVYAKMANDVKYTPQGTHVWETHVHLYCGRPITSYKSSWLWCP